MDKFEIYENSYTMPEIFKYIQALGVSEKDMYHTFNMGIGFILAISPQQYDKALEHLHAKKEKPIVIGKVSRDIEGVIIR